MNTIDIFTFKDGLLSRVAHDLQLRLERFEVSVNEEMVVGTFWPDSLEILGPVKRGKLDPGGLKKRDRADIKKNIQKDILHTRDHPVVKLEAKRLGNRLQGTLALRGRPRPITIETQVRNQRMEGEIELRPSLWGIPPFKALMGAIKLQDRVLVRFSIALESDKNT